jgi:hypothetical protein
MKRDYTTGTEENIEFFVGVEIEHTPAHGQYTLFVTGIHPVENILKALRFASTHKITHIFFGANHSFNPVTADDWDKWETMIKYFLNDKYLCSLDIPLSAVEHFNEGGLNEYNNFIPQIRVPIPYIKLWNYNTMIKIDDTGFNESNPGVWTHSLHELQDRTKFTNWSQYANDVIINIK